MDVKTLRDKMGLSRAELADRMKVTRQTVANWEGGKIKPTGPAEVLLAMMAADFLEEENAAQAE